MTVNFAESPLNRWIQPQHLQPSGAADYAARFAAQPQHYVCIDDFMIPDRLTPIRSALLEDGKVETVGKLYGGNDWVTMEALEAAPDEHRFIHETLYRGPLPGRELSTSVMRDIKLRWDFHTKEFHAWLSMISAQPVAATGTINLKRLDRQHFLRWHNDGAEGRILCMILYLHEEWRPDYGGRLLFKRPDGGADAIEPHFNRLVIFDAQSKFDHAIEPMTPAAADWARLNYSVWFNRSAPSPAGAPP